MLCKKQDLFFPMKLILWMFNKGLNRGERCTLSVIQSLLSKRADASGKDISGKSVLSYACSAPEDVKIFIKMRKY